LELQKKGGYIRTGRGFCTEGRWPTRKVSRVSKKELRELGQERKEKRFGLKSTVREERGFQGGKFKIPSAQEGGDFGRTRVQRKARKPKWRPQPWGGKTEVWMWEARVLFYGGQMSTSKAES